MSEARRLKSRAGCLQCKRRKVRGFLRNAKELVLMILLIFQIKCDESLPACRQCCRRKLQCPGYQKPLKWIEAPEELKVELHPTHRERKLSISISGMQGSSHSARGALSEMHGLVLPRAIDDESSALVRHYFTDVCKIAGCFNSHLSPFRIILPSMMSYSRPVYLLLQASSAVHLSRQYPKMRLKALSLQSEAFSALRDDIGKIQSPKESIVSDELMFCAIISGLTSAWYDVNDVGVSHVSGGQALLSLWLMPQKKRLSYQKTFILGAFVYWIMISAYVAGDPEESFEYLEGLQQFIGSLEMSHDIIDDTNVPKDLRKIIPHPLTGFSIELLVCVGKVGSLCRMQQDKTAEREIGWPQNSLDEKARLIESELLDLIQSFQGNFKDPEDPQTTVGEILSVGEAYRCAGLLQLYTTFPQLLQQQQLTESRIPPKRDNTFKSDGLPESSVIRLNASGEFTILQHNWLRALAVHILKILETIPTCSGTRVLQGLVVLISSAWLVDPMIANTSGSESESGNAPLQHPPTPLRESSTVTECWRNKVRFGLQQHNEYVGLDQVSRIIEIVEEVWVLDDSGGKKCDWMMVVASKGLQTLYG
jgi:hypothetical protein